MEIRVARIFSPYPAGDTNVYILNRDVIIDSGTNHPKSVEGLKRELKSFEMDFETSKLIITHPHVDHFGSAYLFKNVFGHELTCERARDGEKSYFNLVYRHFINEGFPAELAMKTMESSLERFSKLSKPCKHCRKIGSSVKAGDDVLKVIHIPGHSYGHIALYSEEHEVLFAGDTLLNNITPNPVIEPVDEERRRPVIEIFMRTLAQLYELDVKITYTGHREFVRNHRALIEHYLESFMERSLNVFREIDGKSAFSLALKLFGEEVPIFLSMSEVIAHLDFLVDRGFAEKVDERYFPKGDIIELESLWREIQKEITG